MACVKNLRVPCLVCDLDGLTPANAVPCCDEACIDRIAEGQCASECGEQETSSWSNTSPKCCGNEPGNAPSTFQLGKRKRGACTNHSSKARKDFADVLKKVGCICRELISHNLEPCCRVRRSSPLQRGTVSCAGSRTSLAASSETVDEKRAVKIGCAKKCGKADDIHEKTTSPAEAKDAECCIGAGNVTKGARCTKDKACKSAQRCCVPNGCQAEDQPDCLPEHGSDFGIGGYYDDSEGPSCGLKANKDSCCVSESCGPSTRPTKECCDDSGCCDGDEKLLPPGRVFGLARSEPDIEKGTPAGLHVSLAVEGLTCVGCETKLFRALRDIAGVHNLTTSLVLSKAEFDLGEKADSVDEVIRAVERSTGFACKRLNTEGQELDVIIDGDVKAFIQRDYRKGITQLDAIDKHTVRITFDPTIIGARTVVGASFGTQLALAAPRTSSDLESGQKHVTHTTWVTLLSAALTIPVLVLAWAPLPPRPTLYGAVSLALATAVQFVIAGHFYVSALRALVFTRVIEMDLLVVLSTSTAYIFSIIAFAYQTNGHPLAIGEFFETSTLLVTLIMLGRLVSAFARQKAVELVSVRSLQTQTAVLCDSDGRNEQEIDARLLQHGDYFKVAPDSRVTTDGIVFKGVTEIDESMMTGESLPVEKQPGSAVVAGSMNGSGVIVARLTNLPGHNTVSTIAALVDEAKFQKPKTQELVDIVAGYFVPMILVLTVITFVAWIAVGVSVRRQSAGTAVVNAITYAVSVLIVSCPCAIGLCIPMVIVVAGGAAAKHGVIFKSALALESARKVSHVVFDKTGTLTTGHLSVVEEVILADQNPALSITLGLTSDSKHPVSATISAYLQAKGIQAANLDEVRSITGKGVEGSHDGVLVRCGNTRWLSLQDLPAVQSLLSHNLTVFGVTAGDKPLAIFGLADSIHPEAALLLSELKKRKIAVSIVSGDDTGATESLATKLDIPLDNVRSRCTPVDKQEYLKDLKTKEKGTVIFCGDGANDAVALAQADIGVHMSSGSEVAKTAADVVLLRPSLTGILVLLDLSRAAMHRVFLNFAWSFVYNLLAILLAAGAFVQARIPPQYAGLGEIVSVLPVILIAVHLRWFQRTYV